MILPILYLEEPQKCQQNSFRNTQYYIEISDILRMNTPKLKNILKCWIMLKNRTISFTSERKAQFIDLIYGLK